MLPKEHGNMQGGWLSFKAGGYFRLNGIVFWDIFNRFENEIYIGIENLPEWSVCIYLLVLV